jgi:hypothetical protein
MLTMIVPCSSNSDAKQSNAGSLYYANTIQLDQMIFPSFLAVMLEANNCTWQSRDALYSDAILRSAA